MGFREYTWKSPYEKYLYQIIYEVEYFFAAHIERMDWFQPRHTDDPAAGNSRAQNGTAARDTGGVFFARGAISDRGVQLGQGPGFGLVFESTENSTRDSAGERQEDLRRSPRRAGRRVRPPVEICGRAAPALFSLS